MNFHKSIPQIHKNIYNAKNKNEANEIIQELLNSYHIQITAGINQLDAFENAIMNPSLKSKKIDRREEILIKKSKSPKFIFLLKNQECIKIMKNGGSSLMQIAKYLNSHRTPKRRKKDQKKLIINKMDLSRFLTKREENNE